ncbi:MAG: glycosyltransferase family 87 protein [Gemmataceae bacterium]
MLSPVALLRPRTGRWPQLQLPPFHLRLMWTVWAAVAFVVIGRGLLAHQPKHVGIFHVYAQGGADWFAGRSVYPAADGFDVFRYHPFFAAAFVPFGVLPLVAGSVLWRTLLVSFAFGSFRRWLESLNLNARATNYLMVMLAPLTAWDLVAGQTNTLIIAMLLRAVTASTRDRWWSAAIWLAFASLLKLFPLGFAALLIVARPRQLGLRFAAAVAAVCAVPFVLQDPVYVARMYADWFATFTADTGRQDYPIGLAYRDVRFLFRVWWEPLPDAVFKGTVAAFWLASLAAMRWSRDSQDVWSRSLLLGGLGMTLLGPCTEVLTYAILAPGIVWAAWPSRGASAAILWPAYALLASGHLAFLFPFGTPYAMLGPHTFAAILLGAGAGLAWWRCLPVEPLSESTKLHIHFATPNL